MASHVLSVVYATEEPKKMRAGLEMAIVPSSIHATVRSFVHSDNASIRCSAEPYAVIPHRRYTQGKEEGVSVRHLRAIGGLVMLLTGGEAAMAQQVPDLKGTWIPAKGAHLVEGPTRHQQSGTVPVPGDDTLRTHTSKFVFRFDRQEGRTFWGVLSSAKVSEKVIGAISADGKRFVMTDEDGRFDGIVVDIDTLDYCYAHITPTDRAVACGLLIREK
jgi:hypothetical protein